MADDGATCPVCQQTIPIDRFQLHLDGLDGARPECPRTDLVEVARRARESASARSRLAWTNPWSRRWVW